MVCAGGWGLENLGTERGGFEPPRQVSPSNGLANRRDDAPISSAAQGVTVESTNVDPNLALGARGSGGQIAHLPIDPAALVEALRALPAEVLDEVLRAAGR